ncbi:hypothetical protein FB446DRAFT_650441 [Lentinula raphanica]|nr:hypothetical protein FB446DRAFT_650441 [Lentinula raphanica]
MSSSFDDESNVVCKLSVKLLQLLTPFDSFPIRCRRQIARYTCPQCNIPYCSSTCFKSPAHADCSESFYKKQIETDARSGLEANPTQTQERLKMMEILRRFEEDNDNDSLGHFGEDDGEENGEEDEDDLAKRLAGIDIASASPNLLWSLLSDSERAQFIKAVQDPSSGLSQELLLSDELRSEVTYRPWWEGRSHQDDSTQLKQRNPLLSLDARTSPPYLPEPIPIPSSMIQPNQLQPQAKPTPNGPGPSLLYNLCAICFAYAYITRRLAKSPLASGPSRFDTENSQDIEDIEESKRILAQLVPFLIKRKSAVLYSTVSDAIDDVWSKSTVSTSTSTSNSHSETSTFSVLMQDTATLLRPLPIGVVSSSSISASISSNPSISSSSSPSVLTPPSPSSPPGLTPSTPSSPSTSSPSSSAAGAHVTHKLLFYTAHVLSAPSGVLRAVADEVEAYAVRAA